MVAVTRAQAKAAALAAEPVRSAQVDNHSLVATRTPRKLTATSRAQQLGLEKPTARTPKRTPVKSNGRRDSNARSKQPTPSSTNDGSSFRSVEASLPIQPGLSFSSSLTSLDSTIGEEEPVLFGQGPGWVQAGNCRRRESVLSEDIIPQVAMRQATSFRRNSEDVFHRQTEKMMNQHNYTYRWYDRMMREGLEHEETSTGVAIQDGEFLGTTMEEEDSEMVDGTEDGSEDDEEGPKEKSEVLIGTGTSTERVPSAQPDLPTVDPVKPPPLYQGEIKQFQQCPPGVRYSLQAYPTEILDWN